MRNLNTSPLDAAGNAIRPSVAETYLRLLASRGIDYLFANSGTDFPPLIEAYAKAQRLGIRLPQPFVVPHENVAIAMAHGFYMITGRTQAVMVHVGLGTANSLNGIVNAARQNVPIFFTAGRTPITESGQLGSRNNYINWAQEMFDQAGMVREFVKWEYELRLADQLETVVDRALAIANSEPKGPVYLTLPREVLASSGTDGFEPTPTINPASSPVPDAVVLQDIADMLLKSNSPLIITSNAGRYKAEVPALEQLAERFAIPVVQYRPRYLGLPAEHPMHCGYDPASLIPESDLILVLDSDVPWIPDQVSVPLHCKIVHFGADPLFTRYPIRGFRTDIAVSGQLAESITALSNVAEKTRASREKEIIARFQRVAVHRNALHSSWRHNEREILEKRRMTPAFVTTCLNSVLGGDVVLLNEYSLVLEHLQLSQPHCYFGHSPSGGLGWAMGAAMGVRLAKPDAIAIAVVGDGTYMFGNPTPAHYVSRAADLPFLTLIFNNAMWGAVHRATLSMYPDGHAARSNAPPFSCLTPSPDFEQLVVASGGHGEKVDDPDQLSAALKRAIKIVRDEKRQAVLNIICEPVFTRSS